MLSNIGHGGAMMDIGGCFLENRYARFVKDGSATALYSDRLFGMSDFWLFAMVAIRHQ